MAPLVSVIVRTVGHPGLTQALASIAAQTHRPLEVVLVDAAAAGIAMKKYADLPVRVVGGDGALDRASAANAGLAAARGGWLLFLDEDDTIERDHVALLLATAAIAKLPVAYSQTRLAGPSGAGRVFGGPFSRDALMQSNYLAIHAVLFHRSLVDAGARFDTTLAVFEDWDFWVRLAQRTDFAFSGRPTAIYRAEAGASGAGAGANLDREALLAQRERLMAKWQGLPSPPGRGSG